MDNYGSRIRGYVHPPTTGDYTFWIASDDDGELWISDAGSFDPANMTRIAYVDGWCDKYNWDNTSGSTGTNANKVSAPQKLYANRKYSVTVRWSDGTGGGFAGVAWQGPAPVDTRNLIGSAYVTTINGVHVAKSPVPADNATGVAYGAPVMLKWTAPANAPTAVAQYKVYLSTNEANIGDPSLSAGSLVGTVLPSGALQIASTSALVKNATYYWRVDTICQTGQPATDPNNALGPIWSFATVYTPPVITGQPQNTMAFPGVGDSAQFTVAATSPLALTYQWYDSAGAIGGATGQTLTISNVTEADVDSYYCKVTNSDNESTDSASAKLNTKHLLAHYPLDDAFNPADPNVVDIVGGHTGTMYEGVSSVAGVVGTAASFNGNDPWENGSGVGSHIAIGRWNPSELSGQLTVSHWVAWNGDAAGSTWQGSIGKRDGWNWANMMWQIELSENNNGLLEFKREGSYPWYPPDGGYRISGNLTWHHLAVTFDGANSIMYVDGRPLGSAGFSFGSKGDSMMTIGACEVNGGNPYNGYIDDVRLYDYALSFQEVAVLYTDVWPDVDICIGNPAHDIDGDCIVGLGDLAAFCSEWLDCNLVPDCIQP